MSKANLQQRPVLRMEAGSINCLIVFVSYSAANRNLLTIADSLPAHYVEYLLLLRLIILIHLIRRTPKTLTDGAGRMMTDTSGASQLTYKPYGEVNRMNSYGPDIFRYKYTSQQDDQDVGLYYYNARYYDPVLGLFTSADNVTNATSGFGLNHYMYTEGNPVRYGDASGNFLIPLLMAAFAQAMTFAAAAYAVASATAIAATAISTATAIAASYGFSAGMSASAIAQTMGTYLANAAIGAVRFAAFVDALGVVGAGVGFVYGGIASHGSLQGALHGMEVGFKIGTGIQIAVDIVVGSWFFGEWLWGAEPGMPASLTGSQGLLGNVITNWALKYIVNFTISGLYGELVKGIGREAGGHLDPSHNGFKYNKESAYRGQAAADFLSTSTQLSKSLWDTNSFVDECSINNYHSLDAMGSEIVNTETIYFTEKIFMPIFQSIAEGAVWSQIGNSSFRGSY